LKIIRSNPKGKIILRQMKNEKLTKVETLEKETQNLKAWYPKQNQNLNKIQITITSTLIYLKKIGQIIYLL
jgi:hypothetical protein